MTGAEITCLIFILPMQNFVEIIKISENFLSFNEIRIYFGNHFLAILPEALALIL